MEKQYRSLTLRSDQAFERRNAERKQAKGDKDFMIVCFLNVPCP